jgi:very-short-patch-repair endonuclease
MEGVGRLATRQHGVVSNDQLRSLGLDRSAIRRRVASGYLRRIHHAVYLVGHGTLTNLGKYIAAVLACGPHAALSHRSAGAHWGLWAHSGQPSVVVPHGRRALPRGIEVHRSRMLTPRDVTRLDGIPVTSVARTLLDLAAVASPRELARLVDRAERLQVFDLRAVDEVLGRARGRRGARALRAAVADWRPRGTRSELEDRLADLVDASALDQPLYNVLVEAERGRYEVDVLWQRQRVIVELDGFAYHRTRRDRERDAEKDADLELAGYRVVHVTWDDVTIRGDRTIRRLERLIVGGTGLPALRRSTA